MHDWLSRFSPTAMYSVLALSGLSALAGWAAMRYFKRDRPPRRSRRLSRPVVDDRGIGERLEAGLGRWLRPAGKAAIRAAALAPAQRIVVMSEDGPYHWPAVREAIGEHGSLVVLTSPEAYEDTRIAIERWGWTRARAVARRARSAHSRIEADCLILTQPHWLASGAAMHIATADVSVGTSCVAVTRRPWFVSRERYMDTLRDRHRCTLAIRTAQPVRYSRLITVRARVARTASERPSRR
jgi:hypothetical protein